MRCCQLLSLTGHVDQLAEARQRRQRGVDGAAHGIERELVAARADAFERLQQRPH